MRAAAKTLKVSRTHVGSAARGVLWTRRRRYAVMVAGAWLSIPGGDRPRPRSPRSSAPALFLQILRAKAEEAGVAWLEVPTRTVKPSQTCSGCGRQEKKTLTQRMHRCGCGTVLGRDENATRVMLNCALRASDREPARWGGTALAVPMNHETPPVIAVQVG